MSTAIHVRAPQAQQAPAKQSFRRASTAFALASLGAYVLALAKASVIARWFGTTAEMDAFTVAVIVPNLLSSLLTGSAALALVPALAEAERAGEDERARTFRGALWFFALVCSGVALLVFVGSPWIIRLLAPAFDGYRAHLAIQLVRICSPLLLINALYAFASGELLSRGKHVAVAGAPAISTLISLLLIVTFGRFGVHVLAWSLVLATSVQAIAVLWPAVEVNRIRLGHSVLTERVRGVLRQQLPLIVVSSFGVVNLAVDQVMAGFLTVGSVSALNYANALNGVLLQTVAMAASWVALPEFSRLAAMDDYTGLACRIRAMVVGVVRVAAVAVALVFVFSDLAIRLAFQHGAFSAESTNHVYRTLLGYAIGVVPTAAGMLAARSLSALRKNMVLAKIGLILLPVNAGLDYVLMQRWGTMGIGISTSVVLTCSTVAMFSVLTRQIGKVFDRPVFQSAVTACALAAAGAWLLSSIRAFIAWM